ncbi:uncharacterized protein METZ01_LOCUS126602, partial [marine metagenome]
IQPRTLRNKLPTDLIFAISRTTSSSKQLNNWMINHTPKPIVFKYFFMVFACSCAKRMIQFTKIYKNRGLVLHSE